jgi:hypothetical protein
MNERPWKKPPAKAAAIDPNALLIDELAAVRDAKSKAEKREKEILEILKPLGDGEHRGLKCIAAITTTARDTFKSKEFKEDHPELAAKYTEPKPVTTIRIKPLV